MSHWWRAHDEAIDDPKLCLLSDRAHRAWFNLCCLTSASGGILPAMKVVELKLRMSSAKVAAVLGELQEAGLIDEDETGMRPHNWNRRQFKSDVSTERVQQLRERRRNVSRNGDETILKRPQRQSTEAEKKDTEPKGSVLCVKEPFLLNASEEIQQVKEVLVAGNERRSGPKKTMGRPLPDDWVPQQIHYNLAVSLGISVERMNGMAEAMRCWARAEAGRAITKKANWDQAFSGWMRRDVAKSGPNNGGNGNGKSTIAGSAGDAARRIGAALTRGLDHRSYQPDHGLLPPGRVREP